MTAAEQTALLGQRAWEAVHDHGAFRRDFPDDDYYLTVGRQVTEALRAQAVTDEHVEAVARARWPHHWDTTFEMILAGLPMFTPEQAAESAEKKRDEKRALVRSILEAERNLNAP